MRAVIICLLMASGLQAAYSRVATITIAGATGSTQTNITVPFSYSDANMKTVANGGSIQHTVTQDAYSQPADYILTSDATCATQAGSYTWKFENYSASASPGIVWVKIPSLTTSGVTLYACFGNSSVSTWQGGTSEFSTNFKGAWHLATISAAVSGADSTGNGNTGSLSATPPTTVTGQIDGAMGIARGAGFNQDMLLVDGAGAPLNITTNTMTISMWFQRTSLTANGSMFTRGAGGGMGGYDLVVNAAPTSSFVWTKYGAVAATIGALPADTLWHYVVAAADGTGMRIYVDGVVTSPTNADTNNFSTSAVTPVIGALALSNAAIDEVRVSNAATSANQVATEYALELTPGTQAASTDASAYAMSGPSSGYRGFASTVFTGTINTGTFNGVETIQISDGALGGTITVVSGAPAGSGITPYTITPTNAGTTITYTYTPIVTNAAISLSFVGTGFTGGDPAPLPYNSINPSLSVSGSGCTAALTTGTPSGNCTVTLNAGNYLPGTVVTMADFTVAPNNRGTFATSVSSCTSGIGTCPATPLTSASMFTYTYNPFLVGARQIIITNNQGWTNPANSSITVTSADVCTFTAAADGDDQVAGTWTESCSGGGHTTPRSGDYRVITGHHVTCSTTCYGGSAPGNNTTYNLTMAQSGSVSGIYEVATGGTLWLTGNYKLNSSAGANPVSFGILQLDTGATFLHDNNNSASVQYRGVPGASDNWNNLKIGTLGDTCTFGLSYTCPTNYIGVNVVSGVYPLLFNNAGTSDAITYQVYGAGIKNSGSTSIPSVDISDAGGTDGYALASTFDFRNNMWDTTSVVSSYTSAGLNSTNPHLTISGNHSLNSLSGWFGLEIGGTGTLSVTDCTITGNVFDLSFGSKSMFAGCAETSNAFYHGFLVFPTTASGGWLRFDNNLMITHGSASSEVDGPLASDFVGNYMFGVGPQGSFHQGLSFTNKSVRAVGNIGDNDSSSVVEGHFLAAQTPETTVPYVYTVLGNLSVVTPGGGTAGSFSGWAVASSMWAATGAASVYLDHNGASGQGGLGLLTYVGHGGTYYASNQWLQAMRANLAYNTVPASGNVMIFDSLTGVNNPTPNGMVNSAQVDYNNNFGGWPSSKFNASSPQAACKPSTFNGFPYDICASTGGPGAHETTGNPNYISTARTMLTWAASKGYAATVAGATTYIQTCQSVAFCLADLMNFVHIGYQPTNQALRGTSPDGYVVAITGTPGTGWSGTCAVAFTVQDALDLGSGAVGTCSFSGGVPAVRITNPGLHYRQATPAQIAISQTGGLNGTAGSQTVIVMPMDIGPVQMVLADVAGGGIAP